VKCECRFPLQNTNDILGQVKRMIGLSPKWPD